MEICQKAKRELKKIELFEQNRQEIKKCWESFICPKCGSKKVNPAVMAIVGNVYLCSDCNSSVQETQRIWGRRGYRW